MSKDVDLTTLALGVAKLFDVELEVEEGSFVDPDGGLANVKATVRFDDLDLVGTIYAEDLEEAAKQTILVIAAQHLPDEEDYDYLGEDEE